VSSPATEVKDRGDKKNLYEKFGVREYVIVFPEPEYLEKYVLKKDAYGTPEIVNWDEVLLFAAFDIRLNLWEIFEREKKGD
jgi:Uma2 family endonuclease